ncbi:hypothetical protein [Haloarcula litorea]|uniref:hypothetical protein n=1 Tax=Haloarcula litorea TaxID=3032579 RepID=UPI0023E80715|nr:hypothetical protein [Halomicroarcula sp. GDY20]
MLEGLLESEWTALFVLEAFVTFAVFGAYLGVFWALGEVPQLQFSLESFLNQYGIVFFLALIIVRTGNRVLNTVMNGM